jgi:hypothetical protein
LANWVRKESGWKDALKSSLVDLGDVPVSLAKDYVETGARDQLVEGLKDGVVDCIRNEKFGSIVSLSSALENSEETRVPGFKDPSCVTIDGENEGYDLRSQEFDAGSRILVEIAFDWPDY